VLEGRAAEFEKPELRATSLIASSTSLPMRLLLENLGVSEDNIKTEEFAGY